VSALSPLATLKRGYAVVQREGRVVINAKDVTTEDQLEVTLAKGQISVQVVKEISGHVKKGSGK
jgi:exodeoxyribonuclease VII large subunit